MSQNRVSIGQRMYDALSPLGAVVVEEMDAGPRGTVEAGLLSLLHSAVYNAIGVAQMIDRYREDQPAPVTTTTVTHGHVYTLDAKHGRVGSCVCGDTHTFGATR